MQALDALLNRVSVPRLVEPAPTAEQREALFGAALRAPDHGHLQPYRFLTVEGAAREQMGELLAEAARQQSGELTDAMIDKARNGPLRAPLVVVVIDEIAGARRNYRRPSNCLRPAVRLTGFCWRRMRRGLAQCGAPGIWRTQSMWPKAWGWWKARR